MSFAIGFMVFCIVSAIAMEYAPSWVYGLLYAALEKIMD